MAALLRSGAIDICQPSVSKFGGIDAVAQVVTLARCRADFGGCQSPCTARTAQEEALGGRAQPSERRGSPTPVVSQGESRTLDGTHQRLS